MKFPPWQAGIPWMVYSRIETRQSMIRAILLGRERPLVEWDSHKVDVSQQAELVLLWSLGSSWPLLCSAPHPQVEKAQAWVIPSLSDLKTGNVGKAGEIQTHRETFRHKGEGEEKGGSGRVIEPERWLLNKQRLVGRKMPGAGQGSWAQPARTLDPGRLPGARDASILCPGYQAGGVTVEVVRVRPHGTSALGPWPACTQEFGARSLTPSPLCLILRDEKRGIRPLRGPFPPLINQICCADGITEVREGLGWAPASHFPTFASLLPLSHHVPQGMLLLWR